MIVLLSTFTGCASNPSVRTQVDHRRCAATAGLAVSRYEYARWRERHLASMQVMLRCLEGQLDTQTQ
jgi:hypothetical protein